MLLETTLDFSGQKMQSAFRKFLIFLSWLFHTASATKVGTLSFYVIVRGRDKRKRHTVQGTTPPRNRAKVANRPETASEMVVVGSWWGHINKRTQWARERLAVYNLPYLSLGVLIFVGADEWVGLHGFCVEYCTILAGSSTDEGRRTSQFPIFGCQSACVTWQHGCRQVVT